MPTLATGRISAAAVQQFKDTAARTAAGLAGADEGFTTCETSKPVEPDLRPGEGADHLDLLCASRGCSSNSERVAVVLRPRILKWPRKDRDWKYQLCGSKVVQEPREM